MESRSRPAGPEQLLAHAAWARRLAHTLVGEAAAADDLVQETWRAALENPPSADKPLRPWLRTVLGNFARQRARGASRRDARERLAASDEALPGPDELVERLDSQRALTEELALLPEPLRTTVLLRYFEDLEPSEIARRQGLPAGTVRWRLKRGLDELRARLDRRFGDRRRWALLFVPLARPVAPVPVGAAPTVDAASAASPTGVTSGGTGAALAGAWIVSTTTKLISASAAIALAYLGLAWTGVLPAGLSPWPREAPVAVSFRPLSEVVAPSEPTPVETVAPAAARRVVEPAPAAVVAAAAAPAPDGTVTLAAGIFDEAGAALAGGRLRVTLPFDALSEPSGADGLVELELEGELGSLRNSVALLVERQGYACELVDLRVEPGATVQLGNFRLKPGGAISGRVVDDSGSGLGGILITTGSTGDEPGALDWKRYEFYPEEAARAHTRPDGSFLLGGVREGYTRLWASGPGWLASYSAPVEVRAGQESMGVELALEPLPDENVLRGRVIDPAGAPVARADLSFKKHSRNRMVSGSTEADADGRFRFVLPPGMRLSLVAADPAGELASAAVQDLTGGAGEQVLRLTELRRARLAVSGAGGEPLERFAFRLRSAADDSVLLARDTADHASGLAEFGLPAVPFVIEASAPGHSEERIGPLAPASIGERIELALVPLPGLRGRVQAGGAPLAGARVRLFAPVDSERHVEHNGFEVTVEPTWLDEDRSDEQGRFLLTPRALGSYLVRAEHEGYAPTELGPIAFDPSRGAGELTLELGAGGTIEGRVLMPPGPDASGRIVGISRGDAQARTQRTGAGGAFRFERLTPGSWQVRLVDAEIHPHESRSSSTTARNRPPIQFDCRVEEGRTTQHDIDLTGRDERRVSGVLRIDGGAPGAWRAALTGDELFGGPSIAECGLDGEGRFELAAPATGSYRLLLMSAAEEHGMQALTAPVEVGEGTTPWSLDLRTGSLTVENAPPAPDADPEHVYMWEGPGELLSFTAILPDAEGRCRLTRVPLGPGRVVGPASQARPLELSEWPALVHCEVRPGEENTVALP